MKKFDFTNTKTFISIFDEICLVIHQKSFRVLAPNLLELYVTEYCIVAAQILAVKQKYPKVLEFASISCHEALLADQEAFKHHVRFWVV